MKTLTLLLLFLSFLCHAQEKGCIQGKVVDAQSGEPLPGAHLTLLTEDFFGTVTDTAGNFKWAVPRHQPGDSLLVSFVGYTPKSIVLRELVDKETSIGLMPLGNSLKEVSIQAERLTAEEFTIHKIGRLAIYQNPAAKADALLAVNTLPSATTTDESANVSLRGSSPEASAIFLDGVPVRDAVKYSQINGLGSFSIFHTALLESVQVFPGNPPLEYGNSSAGLISLRTSEHLPRQNTYSLSFSLASIGFFSQLKIEEKSSLSFYGNYQAGGPLKWVNRQALKNIRRFRSADGGLHYVHRINKQARLKLFYYALQESYTFHLPQPSYSSNFLQDKRRQFASANLLIQPGRGTVSFRQGLGLSFTTFRQGLMDFNRRLQDNYTALSYRYLYQNGEWKAGLAYEGTASRYAGTFPLYSYANGNKHPSFSFKERESLHLTEVYLYGKYIFSPQWLLGGGIRQSLALFQEQVDTQGLSSQLSLRYQPTEKLHLNLSAGRYHSYRLGQGESSSLLHFDSRQFSLDAGYQVATSRHTAAIYVKNTVRGGSSTYVKGIELSTDYQPHPQLQIQLSFSSLDAKQKQDGITTSTKYDLSYFIRGNLRYDFLPGWTFSAVFLFRQGSIYFPLDSTSFRAELGVYQPFYGETPDRLPAYRNMDLSLSKRMALAKESSMVLFCSLGNVFNFKNVRGYTHNFSYRQKKALLFNQRTLYFGAVLHFSGPKVRN